MQLIPLPLESSNLLQKITNIAQVDSNLVEFPMETLFQSSYLRQNMQPNQPFQIEELPWHHAIIRLSTHHHNNSTYNTNNSGNNSNHNSSTTSPGEGEDDQQIVEQLTSSYLNLIKLLDIKPHPTNDGQDLNNNNNNNNSTTNKNNNNNNSTNDSYNLIITERWMIMVVRSHEKYNNVGVNAVGFAGTLLMKSREDLEWVKQVGPMEVMKNVAAAKRPLLS